MIGGKWPVRYRAAIHVNGRSFRRWGRVAKGRFLVGSGPSAFRRRPQKADIRSVGGAGASNGCRWWKAARPLLGGQMALADVAGRCGLFRKRGLIGTPQGFPKVPSTGKWETRPCFDGWLTDLPRMNSYAICGSLGAIGHPVVTDNFGDPQPIVRENACSPPRLRGTMRGRVSPLLNGPLVPKER